MPAGFLYACGTQVKHFNNKPKAMHERKEPELSVQYIQKYS